MTKRKIRHPAIRCELSWSADFGYGPTEWHRCTWPAEHILKVPELGPFMPAEKHKICALHKRKLRMTDGERVYRFRRLVPHR